MITQFVISQQDTYRKQSGNLDKFLMSIIDFCKKENHKLCYIIHNRETDNHCHCILVPSYEISKKALIKKFSSADIEIQRGTNRQAYDYLTHKNIESKYQYDYEDIQYINWFEDLDFCEWLDLKPNDYQVNKIGDEIEILSDITDNILCGNYKTYIQVLKVYKGVALKYRKSIIELCLELFPEENSSIYYL